MMDLWWNLWRQNSLLSYLRQADLSLW